jgi:hypothetical protein
MESYNTAHILSYFTNGLLTDFYLEEIYGLNNYKKTIFT